MLCQIYNKARTELKKTMDFVAIDFETATSRRDSACAVGIVVVKNGLIVDNFSSLIRPTNNEYNPWCIRVHGITPDATKNSPTFDQVFPKIKNFLQGQTVVAHNESFDRSVLRQSATLYGLDTSCLNLNKKWKCTMKLFKGKGFKSAKLDICCNHYNIPLSHHDALSDSNGCALLYIIHLTRRDFVYPETRENSMWLRDVVSHMERNSL